MSDQGKEAARSAAAAAALERIEEGMTLGLGSGRAVWELIERIGERWPGGAPVRSAFASDRTQELARDAGIEAVELDGEVRLDLAIDGADEIDPRLGLLKGGGAALLREKIVICSAERFLVVAETAKQVERLGETRRLPVEVVRFGWPDTRARVRELVPEAVLRTQEDGAPVVTDEGHHLLDCDLPAGTDVQELGRGLKATVGVVEHGLFVDMADEALLGRSDGTIEELAR